MWRRKGWAVAAATAFLVLSLASAASANPADQGFATVTANGIAGSACETVLANLSPNSSHVNESLWESIPNATWEWWTEVGIWNGFNIAGTPTSVPTFYWEDNNSVYGNSWHGDFGQSVQAGTHYYAYIQHRTGNWWNVYIDGWTWGSGSYHEGSLGYAEAVGDEWTDASVNSESGAVQNVGYWNSSGSWNLGWPNATNVQDGPGQGFWYQHYYYYSTILNQTTWSC